MAEAKTPSIPLDATMRERMEILTADWTEYIYCPDCDNADSTTQDGLGCDTCGGSGLLPPTS